MEYLPKVSIIIPLYNSEKFIKKTLLSAINQTYTNIEIIIVNDGSTDKSEKIVKKIIKKYKDNDIKFFSKNNGGVSTALNHGIKKMLGEYFSWLSSDDIYEKNKIESQINTIKNSIYEKCVVFSNYSLINFNDKFLERNINPDFSIEKDFLFAFFLIMISGCSMLIPKETLIKYHYFNEDLITTQDYAMWKFIFLNEKILYDNNSLVRIRIHKDQVTNTCKEIITNLDVFWYSIFSDINDNDLKRITNSKLSFYLTMKEIHKGLGNNSKTTRLINSRILKYENKKRLDEPYLKYYKTPQFYKKNILEKIIYNYKYFGFYHTIKKIFNH